MTRGKSDLEAASQTSRSMRPKLARVCETKLSGAVLSEVLAALATARSLCFCRSGLADGQMLGHRAARVRAAGVAFLVKGRTL
jgi:hypothetical protein